MPMGVSNNPVVREANWCKRASIPLNFTASATPATVQGGASVGDPWVGTAELLIGDAGGAATSTLDTGAVFSGLTAQGSGANALVGLVILDKSTDDPNFTPGGQSANPVAGGAKRFRSACGVVTDTSGAGNAALGATLQVGRGKGTITAKGNLMLYVQLNGKLDQATGAVKADLYVEWD